MNSKVIFGLCLLVSVAVAVPAGPAGPGATAVSPWVPTWLAQAPWFPKWVPCTTVGASCVDCSTKLACTPVGGIQKACSDPALPYCNLGACSATPSAECAPSTAAGSA